MPETVVLRLPSGPFGAVPVVITEWLEEGSIAMLTIGPAFDADAHTTCRRDGNICLRQMVLVEHIGPEEAP